MNKQTQPVNLSSVFALLICTEIFTNAFDVDFFDLNAELDSSVIESYDNLTSQQIIDLIEEQIALSKQIVVQNYETEIDLSPIILEGEEAAVGSSAWFIALFGVIICILLAGAMSGLTIGLASIDRLSLEIDAKEDPEIAKMVKRIFPVIDKHHWMLVTLLLMNALAMETLPVLLGKLVSPLFSELISVFCVLVFGEIIPQAVCTGPSQTKIAYYMCPVVLCLMYATIPISWPIGWLLDKLMGEHEIQRFDNEELKNLMLLHAKSALKSLEHHLDDDVEGLDAQQERLIVSALQMYDTKILELATPFEKVEILYLDTILDEDCLNAIKAHGFSRIPIAYNQQYSKSLIGIVMAKSFIGLIPEKSPLDPNRFCTVQEMLCMNKLDIKNPLFILKDANINSLLKKFKDGYSHLAIVCSSESGALQLKTLSQNFQEECESAKEKYTSFNELIQIKMEGWDESQDSINVYGILTLENVIERILQVDILDERDRELVMRKVSTAAASWNISRQPTVKYQYASQQQGREFKSVADRTASSLLGPGSVAAEEAPVQLTQAQLRRQKRRQFVKNFADNLDKIVRRDVKRNQSIANLSGVNVEQVDAGEKLIDEENQN